MASPPRSSRSIAFVQKWGCGGTVGPRHSTTRVRMSVIFMSSRFRGSGVSSGSGGFQNSDGFRSSEVRLQWPDLANRQQDHAKRRDVQRADDVEDGLIAEAHVE